MCFAALKEEMNGDEGEEIREKVEKYTRMLSCDNKVGDNFIVSLFIALCKSMYTS